MKDITLTWADIEVTPVLVDGFPGIRAFRRFDLRNSSRIEGGWISLRVYWDSEGRRYERHGKAGETLFSCAECAVGHLDPAYKAYHLYADGAEITADNKTWRAFWDAQYSILRDAAMERAT